MSAKEKQLAANENVLSESSHKIRHRKIPGEHRKRNEVRNGFEF